MIKNSRKVPEYKKNQEILDTINKYAKKEIMDTLPFIRASKKKEYLEINLTKEVKDFYN